MANWISHLIIADKLYSMGIDFDERGFAVGNIAPDCNIENENWTQFTPSRETTHWMKGNSKLTADYERFFDEYIRKTEFTSDEHKAFLLGYYSHLITDVEFQKFVRKEERIRNIYVRLKRHEEMYRQIKDFPEDYDTLKKAFGKNNVAFDIVIHEINYLKENLNSRYNTIIKKVHEFPDYIDYLPDGAIVRKIGIMANEDMSIKSKQEYIFFTQDEFNEFAENTSDLIYWLLKEH